MRRSSAATVAVNLGWMLSNDKGKKHPDVTRVKDAILMGEFQEKLPGIVIKQRTRGDSNKSTIAWSTAKQVRNIVTSPQVLPVLDAMPPEERSGYVQQIAKEYKETPTKHRAEFGRQVQAAPTKPPEDIRHELVARETQSVMLTFRADADLHEAIDNYTASQGHRTRSRGSSQVGSPWPSDYRLHHTSSYIPDSLSHDRGSGDHKEDQTDSDHDLSREA